MEIKCLNCKNCLDLGTCENPKKKTPIFDCFCHKGWWDGIDYLLSEDLSEWEWNNCKDFQINHEKNLSL